MISYHEGAHAIAAYHLRFPFARVRYTGPQGLNWGINHVEPDNDALGVTCRYLEHRGATGERITISLGTVLLIGYAVNIQVNGAEIAEAEAGAGNDFQQLENWNNERQYDVPQRTYLRKRIDEEVHRFIHLAGFRESLDRVAAALVAARSLSVDQVTGVIEQAVGQEL